MRIKTKKTTSSILDCWLTKLENRCFGWAYTKKEVTEKAFIEYYSQTYYVAEDANDVKRTWFVDLPVTETETSVKSGFSYLKTHTFQRVSPYSKNILFNILELLCRLFSFLRRIIVAFVLPLAFVASLFMLIKSVDWMLIGLGITFGTYVAFTLLSALCAVPAVLLRQSGKTDFKNATMLNDK